MTSSKESHEPVTITDKRRIDPETGEVRETTSSATAGAAPPGAAPPQAPQPSDDEAAELKATLQRVKAEYDNYRKRALRQEQLAAERGKETVIVQLLGVLDDLDRARSHGDLESGPLRAVADKLTTALASLGLAAFGDEGEDFDPSWHEAVQHEGDGTHPIIGSVLRRGYRLGDRVIRHALVGVVDTVPDETPDGESPADTVGAAANADLPRQQAAESESPAE